MKQRSALLSIFSVLLLVFLFACGKKAPDVGDSKDPEETGQELAPKGRPAGWMDPQSLSDSIGPSGSGADFPQAALNEIGNVFVVWNQFYTGFNRVYASYYRYDQWFHPQNLSNYINSAAQTGNAGQPRVAMDGEGNAVIVWRHFDGSHFKILRQEFNYGIWGGFGGLSEGVDPEGENMSHPSISRNRYGKAVVVWSQSYDGHSRIYKCERVLNIWTCPENGSDYISPTGENMGDAFDPEVAVDDLGNVLIVWTQFDGSNYQVYKSWFVKGSWSNPGTLENNISPDGTDAYAGNVAVDNLGNAVIVWRQLFEDHYQIYKSEYIYDGWKDPDSLSDHVNIKATQGNATDPRVAMDKNRNAVIVWKQFDGQYDSIYRSDFQKGRWNGPKSLSDRVNPQGDGVGSANVAMGANRLAVIAWDQSDGTYNQVYRSEFKGGKWSDPKRLSDHISPDGGSVQSSPHVVMNDSGSAVIVWSQFNGSQTGIFMSQYMK